MHLKHLFSTRSSVLSSYVADTNINREATPFKKKSSFSSNLNPTILTYRKLVEKDLAEINQISHDVKRNVNESELKAPSNLGI